MNLKECPGRGELCCEPILDSDDYCASCEKEDEVEE